MSDNWLSIRREINASTIPLYSNANGTASILLYNNIDALSHPNLINLFLIQFTLYYFVPDIIVAIYFNMPSSFINFILIFSPTTSVLCLISFNPFSLVINFNLSSSFNYSSKINSKRTLA